MVEIEKGPQRSQWTKSKIAFETWVLKGKDHLFCLARWQMSQQCGLFIAKLETILFNNDNFAWEGCPKRKCHKSEVAVVEPAAEGKEGAGEQTASIEDDGKELCCSSYRPLVALPSTIMFQWTRSWIKQKEPRKTRQQNKVLVSWLTKMRLKVIEGTHKTP